MFGLKKLLLWLLPKKAIDPREEQRQKEQKDWESIVAFCEPIERIVETHISSFWFNLFTDTPGNTLAERLGRHGAIRHLSTKSLAIIGLGSSVVTDRAIAATYEFLFRHRVNMKFINSLKKMSSSELMRQAGLAKEHKQNGFYFYYIYMLENGYGDPAGTAAVGDQKLAEDALYNNANANIPLWVMSEKNQEGWTVAELNSSTEVYKGNGGTFDGAGASGDWEEKPGGKSIDWEKVSKSSPEQFPMLAHPDWDESITRETGTLLQATSGTYTVTARNEIFRHPSPPGQAPISIDATPPAPVEDNSRNWLRESFVSTPPSYSSPPPSHSPPPCTTYDPGPSDTSPSGSCDSGGGSSGSD